MSQPGGPRLYPEDPTFVDDSERVVWQALRSQLGPDAALLHGLRLTSPEHGDVEVDLAVLLPDDGLVVIEVKGGLVQFRDGQWTSSGDGGRSAIHPTDQARKGLYTLRDYLVKHQRWSRGKLRCTWMIALPYTPVTDDLSPDAPRYKVIGRYDLSNVAALVRDQARGQSPNEPPCARHWVEVALDLLAGRGEPVRDIATEVSYRKDHVDRLTHDQAKVLDQLARNQRIEVQGGAGSGKTWLAFEQARRWSADGLRVALLTFGRGLANYLVDRVGQLPASQRPAFTGTFHQLGYLLGTRAPAGASNDWWEVQAPELMREQASALAATQKFDAIVVDEAQDFADTWWQALRAIEAHPAATKVAIFHDDQQRVFGRVGRPEGEFVHVTLGENLRNTRQIATAFGRLVDEPAKPLGGSGPEVQFIEAAPGQILGAAEDAAVGLLEQGWDPTAVALLTTRHRHPMQVEQQQAGQDAYWANFWTGEDMFYGTVMGFKGLERPAVVLAVDGFHDGIDPDEILYCGMSRARDLLIIVGEAEQIRPLRPVDG